jgi:hypothetical protein
MVWPLIIRITCISLLISSASSASVIYSVSAAYEFRDSISPRDTTQFIAGATLTEPSFLVGNSLVYGNCYAFGANDGSVYNENCQASVWSIVGTNADLRLLGCGPAGPRSCTSDSWETIFSVRFTIASDQSGTWYGPSSFEGVPGYSSISVNPEPGTIWFMLPLLISAFYFFARKKKSTLHLAWPSVGRWRSGAALRMRAGQIFIKPRN